MIQLGHRVCKQGLVWLAKQSLLVQYPRDSRVNLADFLGVLIPQTEVKDYLLRWWESDVNAYVIWALHPTGFLAGGFGLKEKMTLAWRRRVCGTWETYSKPTY